MVKTLLTCFLFSISFSLFAQKAMNDYTLQELTQKRTEAVAAKATGDVAVYDEAIKLKKEIDAAIKIEDYDKAGILKDKMKALKLAPPVTPKPTTTVSPKMKELQDAINKAVAAEDYDKASKLKKELEALKNGSSTTTNTTTKTPSTNNSSNTSTPPPPEETKLVSRFTKNDIYGASVTWFGLDFSLFNFVSNKKLGQEQNNLEYIREWQDRFHNQIGGVKLQKWLEKTTFTDARSAAEGISQQNLNRAWITTDSKKLTSEQLETHLQTYKTTAHELGLVFVPESFDETRGTAVVIVVWFDIDTRTIVHQQEITVTAGPSTMTLRWLTGLIDISKKYVDRYYKPRL